MLGILAGTLFIIAYCVFELYDMISSRIKCKRYDEELHKRFDDAYNAYVKEFSEFNKKATELNLATFQILPFDIWVHLEGRVASHDRPIEYRFYLKDFVIPILFGLLFIGGGIFNINLSQNLNTDKYQKYERLQTEYVSVLEDVSDISKIPTVIEDINEYNQIILRMQNLQGDIFGIYLTKDYDWDNLKPIEIPK